VDTAGRDVSLKHELVVPLLSSPPRPWGPGARVVPEDGPAGVGLRGG
jgi:hypothetical protein